MSLKTKFLLPTIILILIGLGVITAISSISARSTLETVLERDARELAKSLTINVSNWLKSVLRDAAVWSTRQEFIDYAPTARESLDKLHTHSPLYAGISLLGMDGTVVYSTNRDNEGKLNLKERDYVKTAMAGKVGMSDINISKVSGMPVVAVAAPLLKNGEVAGAIYMTVNIPALADYFFAGVNTGDHGYMMMFNSHGGLISHPRMQEINQLESVPQYITQMLQGKEGLLFFKDEAGQEYMAAYSTDSSMGWVVAACYQMEELYKQIKQTEMINIIISVVVLLFAIVVIYMLVRSITRPLKETVEVISELAEGEGDLTVRLEVGSKDEVGYLALELNKFIGKLWDMVSLIKDHSISIDRVAQEMNSNNAEINERTQQQAGAIEETSSALEQMTGSVQNNAASARNATQKAEQTYQMAQEGGSVLNSTMTAMQEVTEASQKINAITNVVNEIAFQTNLLALNAAVEAARAGEAGKGFAVVAGEVRNLASRSASAAREIQELISDSVAKIDASNHLVRQSDDILKSIIVSIQQANNVIAGISRVSDEQSVGISEISNAVQQMDQGVQRNSQMVTDNFNLSGEMSRASHELVELLSKFKL